jgi:hypothetical protein
MSMAASSHQSGEVAASVAAVTDVLDHLTVTTHQVHRAIARGGLIGVLPTPVRSAHDTVTPGVFRTRVVVAEFTAFYSKEVPRLVAFLRWQGARRCRTPATACRTRWPWRSSGGAPCATGTRGAAW